MTRLFTRSAAAMAASLVVGGSTLAGGPAIDAITPNVQRVYDFIVITGSGFGAYEPGVSTVHFTAGDVTIEGGLPYLWRDDYIKLRVPVGDRVDGQATPIPKTNLTVTIVTPDGTSPGAAFRVHYRPGATLRFQQRTMIAGNRDVSTFLGEPNFNIARTKDGEVADINGDGWPDLMDNNSNNETNGTHGVVRLNRGDGTGFDAFEFEPLNANDNGEFLAVVPKGGDYMGNKTTYDADLVDLNHDGFPDYVQSVARGPDDHRLRILLNNREGTGGLFMEATSDWLDTESFDGCPDDVAHTDVNYDGWVDVATSLRTVFGECGGDEGSIVLFINEEGTSFAKPPQQYFGPDGRSAHDVFFIDANHDGFKDMCLVTEQGSISPVFYHDGADNPDFAEGSIFDVRAFSGEAADFNADGVEDAVLSGLSDAWVFINDPDSPGDWDRTTLPDGTFGLYDVQPADLDLDGDLDIIVCGIISNADDSIRIYGNNGDGTFVNWTPSARDLLPFNAPYQRLSGDPLDFDGDGDLDLYITGADSQDVGDGGGFGRVPNQFYENTLTCPADFDADGDIDFDDLLGLLANWGECDGDCGPFDLDGSGEVGFGDLLVLLASWGPC